MRTKAIIPATGSALIWILLLACLMPIGALNAAGRPGLNVVVDAGSADTLVSCAKEPDNQKAEPNQCK